MATFRGPKSVLIQGDGEAKPIAFPVYDNEAREYVVEIPDEFADTYRAAFAAEGLREVGPADTAASEATTAATEAEADAQAAAARAELGIDPDA